MSSTPPLARSAKAGETLPEPQRWLGVPAVVLAGRGISRGLGADAVL
ncbi:hypothetical protein ACH49O_30570 [Streptomyces coeruleorubidus]